MLVGWRLTKNSSIYESREKCFAFSQENEKALYQFIHTNWAWFERLALRLSRIHSRLADIIGGAWF